MTHAVRYNGGSSFRNQRACSAVGSAPEWHSGGHRFDPGQVHQLQVADSKRLKSATHFIDRTAWLTIAFCSSLLNRRRSSYVARSAQSVISRSFVGGASDYLPVGSPLIVRAPRVSTSSSVRTLSALGGAVTGGCSRTVGVPPPAAMSGVHDRPVSMARSCCVRTAAVAGRLSGRFSKHPRTTRSNASGISSSVRRDGGTGALCVCCVMVSIAVRPVNTI